MLNNEDFNCDDTQYLEVNHEYGIDWEDLYEYEMYHEIDDEDTCNYDSDIL